MNTNELCGNVTSLDTCQKSVLYIFLGELAKETLQSAQA